MILLLSILGIAILDSLNPSIILMTLYLLSTEKPIKRTASYISGVYLTNLSLGLLAYFGLGAAFSVIISRVFSTTAWWAYGIELIAAIALIYAAIRMKTNTDATLRKKPKAINPKATFALGVGATFIEFSTAAPYLGAIAALVKAEPSAAYSVTALILYNIVYIGIPLILLSIYLAKRQAAEPVLAKANKKISHYIRRIGKVLFFSLGVLLLADFIGYLFGNPIFG